MSYNKTNYNFKLSELNNTNYNLKDYRVLSNDNS